MDVFGGTLTSGSSLYVLTLHSVCELWLWGGAPPWSVTWDQFPAFNSNLILAVNTWPQIRSVSLPFPSVTEVCEHSQANQYLGDWLSLDLYNTLLHVTYLFGLPQSCSHFVTALNIHFIYRTSTHCQDFLSLNRAQTRALHTHAHRLDLRYSHMLHRNSTLHLFVLMDNQGNVFYDLNIHQRLYKSGTIKEN